jgi:hypothetical protein
LPHQTHAHPRSAILVLFTATLLAVLAALALPTIADAANLQILSNGEISITDTSGQANRVTVTYAGGRTWVVSDVVALRNNGGCPLDSATQAHCTVSAGVPRVYAQLRGGDDVIDVSNATGLAGPNDLLGGDGSDTLIGNAATVDVFDGGGGGDDTVSYASRTVPIAATFGCNSGGIFCAPDGASNENDDIDNSVEWVLGGSGNDSMAGGGLPRVLDGRSGDDTLYGGSANDTIFGGPGSDTIYDFGGDDSIQTVDGIPDTVSCGAGDRDLAQIDLKDTLSDSSCENVQRAAVDQGPTVRVAPGAVTLDHGRAQVRLSCPRSPEGRCAGTLTLSRIVGTSGRPSTPTTKGTYKVHTRLLARAPYQLATGQSATVSVPVVGTISKRVQVTLVETDANGKPKTTLATRALRTS